jgi:N-acetylglucosaminyldiphosphoundecaprenol N-acetyl-beta-D-mannosaminyltransferase
MAAHVGRLTAPVPLGVGAAFDIHAGLLPQAAKWMQAAGLEWLYLLASIRHRPSMMVADW